jgi:hypothetical protein
VIVEGAFVKTLFPTSEHPRQPGLLHICYCLGVAPPIALVAYTSSRPWPAATPVPEGVRIFGPAEAASLNQRPFVLYLARIAKLPLSTAWFPEIDLPGQGVIATAPIRLRDQLLQATIDLARRRREIVRELGPYSKG